MASLNPENMKIRLLTFLTMVAMALLPTHKSDAQTVWHNPEDASVDVLQGQEYKGQERENFYHRFPKSAKPKLRNPVWSLSKESAGESIVFSTDADSISIRYGVTGGEAMPHMPATGVSGVDLYTYDKDGGEVWLGARYSFNDTIQYNYRPIEIVNGTGGMQAYTLFLPLYNEVAWMEIGTEKDAEFRFDQAPSQKPIVAYGTSIGQGACASRPGMAWTNILQRRMRREVVNLGFSGSAHMENEVIDLIAEIDAAVYLLDAMPNVCSFEPEQIRDTVLNAVRRLRTQRPDTPILLVDHLGYPHGKANPDAKKKEEYALAMQKEAYKILRKEGVAKLYYLSYEEIAMPQDATIEGSHPSDYGMQVYAEAYEKKLKKILK